MRRACCCPCCATGRNAGWIRAEGGATPASGLARARALATRRHLRVGERELARARGRGVDHVDRAGEIVRVAEGETAGLDVAQARLDAADGAAGCLAQARAHQALCQRE